MLTKSPIWEFLKKWKTPDTYCNSYEALPQSAGVYLLVLATFDDNGVLDHKVLYVGMSRNIKNRFKNHLVKKECQRVHAKDFVKVYFKHCPADQLRSKERQLIQQISPPWNLQHRTRG